MPELMIDVDGVTKSFGDNVALDHVDLQVEAGPVLGPLGPNGAGKTTLVRILPTLLRPESGTALVAGYDAVRDAVKLRLCVLVDLRRHCLLLDPGRTPVPQGLASTACSL